MPSIGERIRAAREGKNLSREALSASIGKSARSLQDYETDKTAPSADVLKKIAVATGRDPAWLLDMEPQNGSAATRVTERPEAFALPSLHPEAEPPSPYASLRVAGQSVVTEWHDEAGIAVALRVQLLTREDPRRLGFTTRIENDG